MVEPFAQVGDEHKKEMKSPWEELLAETERRVGATTQELESLTRQFPILRDDYVEFLRTCNGAEGSIGENYIVLWSTSDVTDLNEAYAVSEFAPGLILIATDGGNEAYGLDLRDQEVPIVQIPLVGMDWSEAKVVGRDFTQFLQHLASAGAADADVAT